VSVIGLAQREDVSSVLSISNGAAIDGTANLAIEPEPLEQWVAMFDRDAEKYPWLVWREEGRVVAFAKAGPHRTRDAYAWTAEVSVYVEPKAHRRGIARALYARLLRLLTVQGYFTLIAGISEPNEASIALHEGFGFERCAIFTRAGFKWGEWHDVGYWELHINHGTPGPITSVAEVWDQGA
jgi:phosphinothricin acetyltransferase